MNFNIPANLTALLTSANLDFADIVLNVNDLKSEKTLRKNFVNKVHVTNKGERRTIRGPEETSKGMWATKLPNGKTIYSNTEDKLYEKLYAYYSTELLPPEQNYTFSHIWELAQNAYIKRHPTQIKTIQSHASDYRRYISDEFAAMDMRNIDVDYLEEYATALVIDKELRISAYKAFKGVVNLAYNYAIRRKDYDIVLNPAEYMDNRSIIANCDQSLSMRTAKDVMHTPEEIQRIFEEARRREKMTQFHGYYIYRYIIEAHDEIGCRPGELVALKWDDIITDVNGTELLHIHAQQVDERTDGQLRYVLYTKNEKGQSKGGRYFPVTDNLRNILYELKRIQAEQRIESEFIFCKRDGTWLGTKDYQRTLQSICKSLGLDSKGSYAFRRDVNAAMDASGMSDASRGKAIGNGPKTNVDHYIHPAVDYANQALIALESRNRDRSTLSQPNNIISFQMKKSSRTANSQAF